MPLLHKRQSWRTVLTYAMDPHLRPKARMLTYLFSSLAIKAVGRTAQMVVKDVRDQFRENPGIMLGTSKPDYARCVSIVTGAALADRLVTCSRPTLLPRAPTLAS